MKIIPIILLFFSSTVLADELYEFKKIDCMQGVQTFSFRDVKIWNIGDYGIWGKNGKTWFQSWEEHSESLKNIEDNDGLYIFNQQYGWHDGKEKITCRLDNGYYQLTINVSYSSHNRSTDTSIGPGEPLRWNPVISVVHNKYGLIFKESAIELSDMTIVNSGSAVDIDICKGGSCVEARYDNYDHKNKKPTPLKIWP